MKRFLARFNKAEYVFKPSQLVKRIFSAPVAPGEGLRRVRLAWGSEIEVLPQEDIGRAIIRLGLYDLTVSEIILRLCRQPQKTPRVVLDIGANIGYMTSVFSHGLKSEDSVYSFEPHPAIFERLERNIRLLKGPRFFPQELALSDSEAELRFMLPSGFSQNEGLGFLESELTAGKLDGAKFLKTVRCKALDQFAAEQGLESFFLVKIDTEGNELAVLKGAHRLLHEKKIQHIVFEDHDLYPTPVTKYLEELGYHIYFLKRGFLKPQLLEGTRSTAETWEPNSFLATADPELVRKVAKPLGWSVLR